MSIKRKLGYFVLILVILAALPLIWRSLQPIRSVKLTLAEKAPLSALAQIRTRQETSLQVTVKGQDGNDLVKTWPEYAKEHTVPVLGLYPDWKNEVTITVTDRSGKTNSVTRTLRTTPLPEEYPTIEVTKVDWDRVTDGFVFAHLGRYDQSNRYAPLTSAFDNYGKVRWLYTGDIGHVLRRLQNGNFAITEGSKIVEIDILGRPTGSSWNIPHGVHHDVIELPNGNFVALSSGENSFEDVVVEIDRASGRVVKTWDFNKIVDRQRPQQPRVLRQDDWLHLNGVDYDAMDDAIVVSGRNQSAVIKVSRATDEITWIIGNHEYWEPPYSQYLLEPTHADLVWQWGQHAPMLAPDNRNRVLIYDNGNDRSYHSPLAPEDNYSRAVEYEIDPKAGTITQVWQYGKERGSELYTPYIGDADYLPGGNRLITFGGITRDLTGKAIEPFDFANSKVRRLKNSAHIVEVTPDVPAQVALELKIADPNPRTYEGYRVYRSEKLPLYPN